MSVADKLANVKYTKRKPVWTGPEDSGKQGGVTQSLLGKFLACPERFRALVIEGLRPTDRFNHRMHYGTMFHLCMEHVESGTDWRIALHKYVESLCVQYPFQQDEVQKWYNVCKIQFPIYLEYWRNHFDPTVRTPLLQEQNFDVPYKLPSGRIVRLRGRWDAVEAADGGVWLVESKTKGDVDEQKIARRLTNDIQVMLYLIALRESLTEPKYGFTPVMMREIRVMPIRGVRYNVIRRPLSGGKGTIKQTKNESIEQYYDRLAQYIRDEPHTYFFRWQSEVMSHDIAKFEERTLIPCLERLCTWFHIQSGKPLPVGTVVPSHYVMPFGCPVVTDEYGTEYDEYILTGNESGLTRVETLFSELEDK